MHSRDWWLDLLQHMSLISLIDATNINGTIVYRVVGALV